RQFVQSRLEELRDYLAFRDRLNLLPAPAEARTREELEELERKLRTEATVPPHWRGQWEETAAARKRESWLDEIAAIQKALPVVELYYRDELVARGRQLLLFSTPAGAPVAPVWPNWVAQVNELLARQPTAFTPDARLPGLKGPTVLTYRALENFQGVL